MIFHTARFLYILLTKKYKHITCEARELQFATRKAATNHFEVGIIHSPQGKAASRQLSSMKIDVYKHKGRSQFRGTILFIPGMTRLGKDDPRVINLCSVLAYCGYIAIAPQYSQITQLLIDNSIIDEMEASMRAMLADPALCPDQRLSVFTASYAGAMSIRAIARPTINKHIPAFCAIGSPHTPLRAFSYVLGKSGATDQYAKLILLRNLLRLTEDFDPHVDQALSHMIDDVYENTCGKYLTAYLDGQAAEIKQQITGVTNNVHNTHNYLQKYFHQVEKFNEEYLRQGDLKQLHCHVTLIHSVYDTIFSTVESKALYDELRANNIPCRMLITPLLDHVNHNLSWRQAKQTWQLLKTFSYFFRYIK